MSRLAKLTTALALACVSSHALGAQATVAPSALDSGAWVRATVWEARASGETRYRRIAGRLLRLRADTLLIVQNEAVLAIPRASVARLDAVDPRRSRGRATLRGAGAGGGLGLLGGALNGWAVWEPCDGFPCASRPVTAVILGGVAGALGATTGGMVGFATYRPTWRRVALDGQARVGLVAHPAGVAVALCF